MKLLDKVGIITGGASGMGRATAIRFAEEGAKVVVVDLNAEGGEETVKLIEKKGGDAFFVKTDVTKNNEIENMVKQTLNKYGSINTIFNNAGWDGPLKVMQDTTEEDFDRLIDINLKSVFLCSKQVIPHMIKQGGGTIINAASESGLIGHALLTVYCAAKAGVILLTKAMSCEYAKYNIRVNCTCPGMVRTPMMARQAEVWGKDELEALAKSASPFRRVGKPEEIASVVVFLASDDSSWITGAAINVDGGWTATCGDSPP